MACLVTPFEESSVHLCERRVVAILAPTNVQPSLHVAAENQISPLTIRGLVWDNPTMIVTLDAKRRVSIPAALAPAAPGDQFDASFDADEDVVILRRVKRKSSWLAVWKQCPVPMDDLPLRSRTSPKRLKP